MNYFLEKIRLETVIILIFQILIKYEQFLSCIHVFSSISVSKSLTECDLETLVTDEWDLRIYQHFFYQVMCRISGNKRRVSFSNSA